MKTEDGGRRIVKRRETDWTETSKNIARVAVFSDAVFAIAITLLILTIPIPERQAGPQLGGRIIMLWPRFLGYITSFLVVGRMWFRHLQFCDHIKRFDASLAWINLVLLMLIAFLPFPTAVFGTHTGNRTAVIFYALSVATTGIVFTSMWWYAKSHPKILGEDIDQVDLDWFAKASLFFPVGFLISIVPGYFYPSYTPYFWLVLIFAARYLRYNPRRYR